jgi:beta-glucosidase
MRVADQMYSYAFSYVEAGLLPCHKKEWAPAALVNRIANLAVGIPAALFTLPLKMSGDIFTWLLPQTPFEKALEGGKNWESIDTSTHELAKHAPADFKFGVATCDYQYLGGVKCPDSQWAHFKASDTVFDIWGREDEVIAKLVEHKMDSFRFSVEWSRIEPQKERIDESAIRRYVNFARKLKEAGIEPMVTLHHFSEPKWFSDAGGFEKEENIKHFLDFSKRITSELKQHVKTWCTINEPSIYAFMGYIMGDYPPAHKNDIATAGEVIKNMLLAHCQVYDDIKEIDPDSSVGISHQALRFLPYSRLNVIADVASKYLTAMVHDPVVKFFETGKFSYQIPLMSNVTAKVENVQSKLDWFGLQCYVRPLLGGYPWSMSSLAYPGGEMTQMEFRSDPGAIYEALQDVSRIKKPIYITENGIPTDDDGIRERYMTRSMYSVAQAIKEGVDVQRYYAWSLTKNIEWHQDHPDFGLFDRDTLQIKEGARSYLEEILAHKNRPAV